MATRSYVIPDIDDDDNETESVNLFSKRLKTDNSSTVNDNTLTSSTVNENISTLTIVNETTSTINDATSMPLSTINDTETSSNSHLLFFSLIKHLI